MGYGASRKDAGETIGQSGGEGIDRIVKEDRLRLDIIYTLARALQQRLPQVRGHRSLAGGDAERAAGLA